MKSSPMPDIKEPDNFQKFIKYRKGEIRDNLISVQKKLKYYYNHYNCHEKELHKIKPKKLVNPEKKTIIDIYESYDSKAIIDFRDTIFEHMPICPYCGLNETEHLDHYLPKSEFSEYSLYTKNIIPCCYNCNSTYKKTGYAHGGARVYFHPYIDEINEFEILKTSIRWTQNSLIINYMINQSSGLKSTTTQVLKTHFKHLQLGNRYLQYATNYLSDMKPRFNEEYGALQDSAKLRIALESKYRDALFEHGHNHWKTALLKNIKDNELFCNGGFLNAD